MFWLKYIQGLFKALNENRSPNEVAAGVALGMIIGLIPKGNLLALLIWVIIMIFQVNISMATAAIVLFAIFGHITDPVAEKLGFFLLSGVPALKGLWTALYNTPIIPFTNFNNTLVMGNFALGLLLFVPVFFAMRRFVVVYRLRYRERVMQWKLMKAFQASAAFDLYQRWMKR
jgi:uncharacterized protein (TIGR03546 family)